MNPLELRQWAIECAITVGDDPDEILAFAARLVEFVENKPPEAPTVERRRAKWGTSWTPERDMLLLLQYPDAAFRSKDILRRINEIEGAHITPVALRLRAHALGVRRPIDGPGSTRTAAMRESLAAKRMTQASAP